MLLGHKISDRVAQMRDLPQGIDQRSACRHPDWTGPDDLEIKIGELREITDWEKPVFVKVGATRTYYDTQLAVKAGADVIVVDGMQGGTAATQDVFIEHVGIPTLPAIRLAVDALQELGLHREVQLIVSGGIRTGRRRGQGARARRRRGLDRHRGAHCDGGQRPRARRGLSRDRQCGGLLRRLAGGPGPGRHLDPGRRARRPLRPGARRPQDRQLPPGAHPRDADAGAGLRQVARAQPRAGGSRGAHGRGVDHGRRAAGRDAAALARRDRRARRGAHPAPEPRGEDHSDEGLRPPGTAGTVSGVVPSDNLVHRGGRACSSDACR